MKIIFLKSEEVMKYGDKTIKAWCKVRNELNQQRSTHEVVYTEPEEHPYYPRRFPSGTWNVYRPIAKKPTDTYLYPYFIPTDAQQEVDLWEVKDGKYIKPSGAVYMDKGYGIHYSTSNTTLGCIRIKLQEDLVDLATAVTNALNSGDRVTLEVRE